MGSEPKAGSSSTTKFSRVKPGQRQQVERDALEVDGAADGGADVARDAELEAADVDERRNESEQEDDDEETEDDDQPAIAARLGRRFLVGLVVGVGRVHGVIESNFADGLF